MQLSNSERKVMNVFWEKGPLRARDAAAELNVHLGWSKTTSYTMLTRCVEKGFLSRSDPHFLCTPLVTREQVCEENTDTLIDRDYGGSADLLVASLVNRKKLSSRQMKELYEILRQMEEEQ